MKSIIIMLSSYIIDFLLICIITLCYLTLYADPQLKIAIFWSRKTIVLWGALRVNLLLNWKLEILPCYLAQITQVTSGGCTIKKLNFPQTCMASKSQKWLISPFLVRNCWCSLRLRQWPIRNQTVGKPKYMTVVEWWSQNSNWLDSSCHKKLKTGLNLRPIKILFHQMLQFVTLYQSRFETNEQNNYIMNKKVLPRERKRHTARRVASACYAALSNGGGGVPPHHPELAGQVPWVPPTTIQTWLGGYPLQHPDLAGGYPPPSRPG